MLLSGGYLYVLYRTLSAHSLLNKGSNNNNNNNNNNNFNYIRQI